MISPLSLSGKRTNRYIRNGTGPKGPVSFILSDKEELSEGPDRVPFGSIQRSEEFAIGSLVLPGAAHGAATGHARCTPASALYVTERRHSAVTLSS